jgi:hypothetical protein
MAAYLIVDVDDLLRRFRERNMSVDLQELAVGLRGGAALAAGLVSVDRLKAIAVANWSAYSNRPGTIDPQYIFKAAGYEVFEVTRRDTLADVLIIHYFSYDPDPIDELILATTSRDLLPLIRRIKITRSARIRMWGSEDVLKGTEFADEIIFQPLETLLGIQTKNVSVYVDFENIAISLNEQGFVVNLDHLIERYVSQARAHGQVVKMAAYAPWGQRGTLPPLLDRSGREIADDAPARLMMANIDPVFNLPGKNSADIRIARDVLADASHMETGDVIILASGDRDFNDVINSLVQRGKTVIIWSVRGSTSRQIEKHPAVTLEYIEDFTNLQTHQSLSHAPLSESETEAFNPSLWSSVVVQFDRLATRLNTKEVTVSRLLDQLVEVGAIVVRERGEDLISQAISLGLLRPVANNGLVGLNPGHPISEKTRAIRDSITRRVANTLKVRGWQYVNYGFLLNGLEMERELTRPGMNLDDQWRSHWIDALVREQVLQRELVPHRHNPDDLVPVIRLPDNYEETTPPAALPHPMLDISDDPGALSPEQLMENDPQGADMSLRIVVSVEQFTSFRNFAWCPLGSLHRRLKPFDNGMSFQRAVEYLEAIGTVIVSEYPNPQSNYNTKGISINTESLFAREVLVHRDEFIRLLLKMYERNVIISAVRIQEEAPEKDWNIPLWISVMETENVLNPLPGRTGQYSLFRTHHTVKLVAGDNQ